MMEAQELGIVVSGEAASAAAHMTDRLNIASRTIKAMTFEIGAALAPTVVKLANIVTGIVVNVTNWIRENQQLVKTIAIVGASVAGAGVALIGLGLAAKIVAISIGGLLSIMSVLGTVAGVTGGALAAVLSPISLISIAIVGLGALILSTVVDIGGIVDNVKTVFRGLAADIFGVLSSITDAIIAGDLETAVKIAGKSIELAWALTMDSLKSAWDGVVDHIANSKLYNSKWAQIGAAGFELGVGRLLGEDDAYLGNLLPNKDGKDANERARDRQKEIEDLTEELRKLRESVPPGALGDRAAAFLSAFEGFNGNLGATSATGPSVRGLFDATAIGSLASPVEDKIEKHTRQTADNTKRMREAIERGGGGLRYT